MNFMEMKLSPTKNGEKNLSAQRNIDAIQKT
jgi:hypothetical protein